MASFTPGSYVFHLRCGVCKVENIAPLSGDDSGSLYYVLTPLFGEDKGNIVRVPLSNPSSLRDPINKEDAEKIIKCWPKEDINHYIVDSKKRKTSYEDALKLGDIKIMAPLLVGAKQRKQKDGHLNSMDGQFVHRVEPIVYGELALALGVPIEQVPSIIASRS